MKIVLISVAAVALMTVAAPAADMSTYDQAPAPAYTVQPQASATNWQGAYAGVQLGGGRVHVSGVGNDAAFVGGVHAGYLFQRGNLVAGPEVDVDMTGYNVGGTDLNPAAHAKIRAGVAMDNILVTGAVGYGRMWANGDSDGGLSLGAGMDMAITDHLVGGADYTYTSIDNFAGGSEDVSTHTVRGRLSYKFN